MLRYWKAYRAWMNKDWGVNPDHMSHRFKVPTIEFYKDPIENPGRAEGGDASQPLDPKYQF